MAMNVEAKIRELKRRVREVEGSFGFLTRQVKGVHNGRFDQVDKWFDRWESKLDGLDRKIDSKVDGLAKALPGIVGDAVRQANREHDKKR